MHRSMDTSPKYGPATIQAHLEDYQNETVWFSLYVQVYLRVESGWAIGAMSLSLIGILATLFVVTVFARHNNTPIVKAAGRELSYVLLSGILLCYSVTFALVMRPTDFVCGVQR